MANLHYPILQAQRNQTWLQQLLGGSGQSWIQHLKDAFRSHHGKIFKTLVAEKYLDFFDGMFPGSGIVKQMVRRYLDHMAYQYDLKNTMRVDAQKQARFQDLQKRRKEEVKRLASDYRDLKEKQTGRRPNMRRSNNFHLEYMTDNLDKLLQLKAAQTKQTTSDPKQKADKTVEKRQSVKADVPPVERKSVKADVPPVERKSVKVEDIVKKVNGQQVKTPPQSTRQSFDLMNTIAKALGRGRK